MLFQKLLVPRVILIGALADVAVWPLLLFLGRVTINLVCLHSVKLVVFLLDIWVIDGHLTLSQRIALAFDIGGIRHSWSIHFVENRIVKFHYG